jgi:hypothetical protein
LWRREFPDALERTTAARVLATEHGFPTWLGQAKISHGWVLSEQGRGAEGVAEIRDGLSLFAGMSDELFRPYYLAKLADALARSGHVAEGLTAVDEVIESYRRESKPNPMKSPPLGIFAWTTSFSAGSSSAAKPQAGTINSKDRRNHLISFMLASSDCWAPQRACRPDRLLAPIAS